MDGRVFLLVVFSACCHAAWNFAARKVAGNLAVIWLAMLLAWALLLPAVLGVALHYGRLPPVSGPGIACIITTGLVHAVYFGFLAAAYEHGEISLVYPIARGSGIALTAVLARLFLKESVTCLGAVGIGLICVGILTMSAPAYGRRQEGKPVALALCVGATIVCYSLVDKTGVGHVNPVVYLWAMYMISAAVLTPFVLRRHRGTLRDTLRQKGRYTAIIGIGSFATYLMILFAYTWGPVGYIVAVREFAVVIGALAGVIVLKERFTATKAVAVVAITIGMICIKAG